MRTRMTMLMRSITKTRTREGWRSRDPRTRPPVPAFVEVCVGECPESNARAEGSVARVLAVPAAVARGSRGVRDAFADGTSTDELPAALLRAPGTATSLVAVRTRFENGRLALPSRPPTRKTRRLPREPGALACPPVAGHSHAPRRKTDFGRRESARARIRAELLAAGALAERGGRRAGDCVREPGRRRRAALSASASPAGPCALELNVAALQVDDPHPGAAFPVVVWHDPERGPLLRATLTSVARAGNAREARSRRRAGLRRNTKTDDSAASRRGSRRRASRGRPRACTCACTSAMWRLVAFAGHAAAPPRESISSPISGSRRRSTTKRRSERRQLPIALEKIRRRRKPRTRRCAWSCSASRAFAARVTFEACAAAAPAERRQSGAGRRRSPCCKTVRFEVGRSPCCDAAAGGGRRPPRWRSAPRRGARAPSRRSPCWRR